MITVTDKIRSPSPKLEGAEDGGAFFVVSGEGSQGKPAKHSTCGPSGYFGMFNNLVLSDEPLLTPGAVGHPPGTL